MGEGLKKLRWSAIALHEFAVPGGYFIGPGRDGRGQIGPVERPTARLLDQVARSGRVPTVTDEMRRLTRDDVRYWNGDAIVLARHLHGPALKQLLDELFGRGEYVDDVWLWRVGPRDE
jgi:hypothetical protein